MSSDETTRLHARPWALVRQSIGGREKIAEKARAFVSAVAHYGREDLVAARLCRLQNLGHISIVPNRIQRMVGAVDMVRFFIVPAANDYYREKGIDFTFHSFLRFLDDPASVIDPTGFNSTRDRIIGHVMQVVHANPQYDFQLLDTFEDGMQQMEDQVRALLAGTHPRTKSIRAIVEEPDYHERLLEHVVAHRKNPGASRLVRSNVSKNFSAEERTFGTVPAAMRYFCAMPSTFTDAVMHVIKVRKFPLHLAEPEPERISEPEPEPVSKPEPVREQRVQPEASAPTRTVDLPPMDNAPKRWQVPTDLPPVAPASPVLSLLPSVSASPPQTMKNSRLT